VATAIPALVRKNFRIASSIPQLPAENYVTQNYPTIVMTSAQSPTGSAAPGRIVKDRGRSLART